MALKDKFFINRNKYKSEEFLGLLKQLFPYEACNLLDTKDKNIFAVRVGPLRKVINLISSDNYRANAEVKDIIFIYDSKNKIFKVNGHISWKLLQIDENNQISDCVIPTVELLELHKDYEITTESVYEIIKAYLFSDLFDSIGNQEKNIFPSNKLLYELSLIPMFDSRLGNNKMMDNLIFEENLKYIRNFKVQDFFYLASTLEYDSDKQNEIFINGITWDDFFQKEELVPLKEMLDICCSQFSDTDIIEFLKRIWFVNFANEQKKYASRSY